MRELALSLSDDGHELVFHFDSQSEHTGIADVLRRLDQHGIDYKDLQTRQRSLEEIFVSLVHENVDPDPVREAS